jgi:hypothetical protein
VSALQDVYAVAAQLQRGYVPEDAPLLLRYPKGRGAIEWVEVWSPSGRPLAVVYRDTMDALCINTDLLVRAGAIQLPRWPPDADYERDTQDPRRSYNVRKPGHREER